MCLECSNQTLCIGEKSLAFTSFMRPRKGEE
jgi:hypothetical protein